MKRRPLAKKRTKKTYKSRLEPTVKAISKVKSTPFELGSVLFALGNLRFSDFIWPAREVSSSNSNRETNVIYVKGLKLHRRFEYAIGSGSTNDIGVIRVHHVLAQLKNDEDSGELALEIGQQFFRDESFDSRARDFFDYTALSGNWDQAKTIGKLNPDNKINILWHKTKCLQARSNGVPLKQTSTWTIDRYIPINKNMNFRNFNDNTPNNRIFELFWYNTDSAERFPSLNPVQTPYISTQVHKKVFFADANP